MVFQKVVNIVTHLYFHCSQYFQKLFLLKISYCTCKHLQVHNVKFSQRRLKVCSDKIFFNSFLNFGTRPFNFGWMKWQWQAAKVAWVLDVLSTIPACHSNSLIFTQLHFFMISSRLVCSYLSSKFLVPTLLVLSNGTAINNLLIRIEVTIFNWSSSICIQM